MLNETVRGGGIPPGLQGLLVKLGVLGKMAEGQSLVGKAAKGMKGKEGADGKGPGKGGALTEDGALLTGLGYNTVDHRSTAKNVAERANLERFLAEMGPEAGKEQGQAKQGKGGEEAAAKATKREGGDPTAEAKDPAGAEQARTEGPSERAEEGRVVGRHETQEAAERRETKEAEEPQTDQHGGRGQDDDEDQDKPGGGWVAEELEERDDEKVALRNPDVLADQHRCRASLGDGSRCLRRSVKGSQYCREHFVPPARRAS